MAENKWAPTWFETFEMVKMGVSYAPAKDLYSGWFQPAAKKFVAAANPDQKDEIFKILVLRGMRLAQAWIYLGMPNIGWVDLPQKRVPADLGDFRPIRDKGKVMVHGTNLERLLALGNECSMDEFLTFMWWGHDHNFRGEQMEAVLLRCFPKFGQNCSTAQSCLAYFAKYYGPWTWARDRYLRRIGQGCYETQMREWKEDHSKLCRPVSEISDQEIEEWKAKPLRATEWNFQVVDRVLAFEAKRPSTLADLYPVEVRM